MDEIKEVDEKEHERNFYLIKRKLSSLKKNLIKHCFYYYVGNFTVHIFTQHVQEEGNKDIDECLTKYDTVNVNVYEATKNKTESIIRLEYDDRFKDYKPIQYAYPGYSNGIDMPINHLCELVRYLHKLSNLSAFL